MHLHYSLAILLSYFCSALAIEDFIKKWRNELLGPIEYIHGSDVGGSVKENTKQLDVPVEEMVKCIKDVRQSNDDNGEFSSSGITKFENVFKFFGICVCFFVTNKQDISKCSATIDYSQKELQYRHYHKFQLDQKLGDVKFFEETNLPTKKENVFVKTVINRGSKDVTSEVSLKLKRDFTYSIASNNEIGASVGGSVELGLGKIFTFKAEIEAKYSYSMGSEVKTDNVQEFTINEKFKTSPNSSSHIVCEVERQDFDLVWEIPVTVTGAVAINLNNKNREGDWIFVDLIYVARYYRELSLSRDNPPKLQGFIRGITRGSQHFNARAYAHPEDIVMTPVESDMCNPLPSKVKK